jgi:hypothetical protein
MGMVTWLIEEMRPNPHNTSLREDPDQPYSWTLSGNGWRTGSGAKFKELQPLLAHFGVDTLQDLEGKTFESERKDAGQALNLLLTTIRHGGNYQPPSKEELQLRAAQALSEGKLPDYSDVDDHTVFEAFFGTFKGSRVDEQWFEGFKLKITELSNGRVSISRADINTFKMRVMGPAEYLALSVDGESRRLVFGPDSTPFSFD